MFLGLVCGMVRSPGRRAADGSNADIVELPVAVCRVYYVFEIGFEMKKLSVMFYAIV